MIEGIDVSRWQGLINWRTVIQHKKFAIIKIGGSDQGFYIDGQATRNVLEARSVGMPIGFYVYLGGAGSIADEINHIKNLVSNIGGLRQGEFVALDWEEHHADEVGYIYGIAKGLIDAGFPAPPIYMSLSRVRGNNWKSLVGINCALWVAAWGNNDAIPQSNEVPDSDEWEFWAWWQYSSTGSVPGIAGRVDLNQFAGTVEQFLKYGSTRQVTLPAPVNQSRVVFGGDTEEYVVVKDDNLSKIAARFGKSWQELWNMNRDRVSNPDRIFPGLKLRVWATPKPANPPQPTSTHQDNYYVVQKDDNLSVIAARFKLPSYIMLWEANKDVIGPNPNIIRPGQRLRIP